MAKTKEEKSESQQVDNELAAKVRSNEKKLNSVITWLENMFNFDVDKNGKIGAVLLAVCLGASCAFGLSPITNSIFPLADQGGTNILFDVDNNGSVRAQGTVTAPTGVFTAVSASSLAASGNIELGAGAGIESAPTLLTPTNKQSLALVAGDYIVLAQDTSGITNPVTLIGIANSGSYVRVFNGSPTNAVTFLDAGNFALIADTTLTGQWSSVLLKWTATNKLTQVGPVINP